MLLPSVKIGEENQAAPPRYCNKVTTFSSLSAKIKKYPLIIQNSDG